MEVTKLEVGRQFSYSRKISVQDVQEFTRASHDANIYHIKEDASGKVVAHGLLVASLITKIGGDLNFLARTMTFDFQKPTYSGDTLTCTATSLVEQSERMKCKFSFTIRNQDNEVVMVGEATGMIRKSDLKTA